VRPVPIIGVDPGLELLGSLGGGGVGARVGDGLRSQSRRSGASAAGDEGGPEAGSGPKLENGSPGSSYVPKKAICISTTECELLVASGSPFLRLFG
jgi:hypothetical protein